MKQTITFSQFHDAFRDMGRLDNFSYDGLKVLYDWFEDLDDDCGTETELDVIAICCEFSEADDDEIIANYGLEDEFRMERRKDSPLLSDWRVYGDREHEKILDYLNYRTMVCGETSDTIIYADF
jgi:hypothetical protein